MNRVLLPKGLSACMKQMVFKQAKEEYLSSSRTSRKVLGGEKARAEDRNTYENGGVKIQQVEYYYESPKSLEGKHIAGLYHI